MIPHLLVPDLRDALTDTWATRVLTMNLVPAEDETQGYTASRHLEVLADHAPRLRLDVVVVDPSFAEGDAHLERYVTSLGGRLVLSDVRMRDGSARHDPLKLAAVYAGVMDL